jgi:hypothetical protein
MPNWCNNNISISGPAETIRQLWEDAHADAGDNTERGLLDAMVPMPKELQGTTSPSETGNDWYTWRVNNWGTKWDISTEGLEITEHGDGTAEITGWFDSAWAPPIGAYEKFCDDMDNCDLEASYYEPGMDFAGFWSAADGDEYCDNLHAEYELPEDDRSGLFQRLDEEFGLCEQFEQWDEDYEDA